MGKSVSILIASFNTRELTLACIESVYAHGCDDFEVIVIDNASDDGSADAISKRFPDVTLIRSEQNVGFARANNLAASLATGEYLLLLNSDCLVLDDAVAQIVRFAQPRPDACIFGGRTFFADGRLNPSSCHGRQTPWSLFCLGTGLATVFRGSRWFDPESLGSWRRDTVSSVDAVTGCFMLIRREFWESLKGFDESFFMYGEDTDLCLRAWNANSACIICPDAKIIHHGGRSEKVRSEKMLRLFEAKAKLIEKHWKRSHVWFGVRMLDLWCLTRMIMFGLAACINAKYAAPYHQWARIWHERARFHLNGLCSGIATPKEMAGAIGPS